MGVQIFNYVGLGVREAINFLGNVINWGVGSCMFKLQTRTLHLEPKKQHGWKLNTSRYV